MGDLVSDYYSPSARAVEGGINTVSEFEHWGQNSSILTGVLNGALA